MSVDYSAILTDPYATTEQKNNAYYQRLNKEKKMKADGTWDNSWATTTDLYTPQPTAADYMAQARREAERALNSSKASQKESVAAQSKALEQQAYIQKMQSMGNLQAANALSGQTGGLAETTALAPQTAYGNALNTIGANRLEANRQIDQAADAQALQLAVDFADKQINQMNLDREFENANYWNNKNWDFSQTQYADSRKDTAWSQSFQEREAAWDKAVSIIASGTMPPDDLLAQAGLTREKAAEMMAYLPKTGSGGGKGTGSGTGAGKPAMTLAQATQALEDGRVTDSVIYAYDYYMGEGAYEKFYGDGGFDQARADAWMRAADRNLSSAQGRYQLGQTGGDQYDAVAQALAAAVEQGALTKAEAEYIAKQYGFEGIDW